MPFESISITLNASLFLIIIGTLLLFSYSFYIYKYTIPQVSKSLRRFLSILRGIIITLILLLIFEPVVSLIHKELLEPKVYVFIDNSRSVAAKDSLLRLQQTFAFVDNLKSLEKNISIISFGSKTARVNLDSLEKIRFEEPSTNFSNAVSLLKENRDNISVALFISDGIITDGINPIYEAEKLGYPLFTIGIGDTSRYRDILIKDVFFNQFIYANQATEIEAVITHNGFENQKIFVSLYDENSPMENKEVVLSSAGINRIKFDFIPNASGERKMRIAASRLNGESNFSNNQKVFFINVIENKLKIGLVAGSPSPDVSAISKVLEDNKDLSVIKLIQVSENKLWNDEKITQIDSADVLFLIDFPSSNVNQQLLSKVINNIEQKNKPYFILVSPNIELQQLKNFERFLPFSIGSYTKDILNVQPEITGNAAAFVMSNRTNNSGIWNNLPPLTKISAELLLKPGSNVLVKARLRNSILNSPLVISRNIGNQLSIAFLAGDIWRWQLSNAEKQPDFFTDMINDFVKWLAMPDKQKQFQVYTSKKIYSAGEQVELFAELYDQTYTPIDSANIKLTITKGDNNYELAFEKVRDGLFQAIFDANETGDFSYYAETSLNGLTLNSSTGRFNIGEVDVEKINTRMDLDFLNLLARSTYGEFYFVDNSQPIKEKLESIISSSSKEIVSSSQIDLRANTWLMFLIICLFSFEWFIRKRTGML